MPPATSIATGPAASGRTATLAGLGAIGLWGLLALFTVGTAGIPPFQLTAMTFFIGGALLLAMVAARGRLAEVIQPLGPTLLGTGGLFGYHAAYFAALKFAPPAEASLINYLWPLLIVVFSGLLPGEKLRAAPILGALLGFAGVVALAVGKGLTLSTFVEPGTALSQKALFGYGLAFACAFIWAGYSVLSRRVAQVPSDAVAGTCLLTALLAAICHLSFESTASPSSGGWLAIVALGLGPVGAAFFFWDMGMKRGDIRFLGAASYAAPIISTAALVLGGAAPLTGSLALACLLIVAGAAVATR